MPAIFSALLSSSLTPNKILPPFVFNIAFTALHILKGINGSFKLISIRGLVNKICEKLGKNFSEVVLESEERLGKDQSYMLDSDKLRKSLNWEDSINLDSGIDTVINWIDNNRDAFEKMPHNYIHKI